jgi:hypothetical protein
MLHRNLHSSIKDIAIPKEADPGSDNLAIDFNKEEFPELAVFKGVKFEFVDKNAKAKDGSNSTWDDVDVIRKENGCYLIEFTKGDIKKSFVTVPVLEKADLEKTFAAYDQVRIRRMARLKNISDSITALRSQFEKEHEASKNLNEFIAKTVSKGKFLDALNEYVDMESSKLLTRQGTLTRMAMVRRFGIYNFDCAANFWVAQDLLDKRAQTIREQKEKKTLAAHYYFGKKRMESDIETVYMIKRDFNGIFKLEWKEIFDFPAKEGSNADILIVVTKDKQFYYMKDEEFKNLDFKAKDIAFNLRGAPNTIKTPGQMKEFFEN